MAKWGGISQALAYYPFLLPLANKLFLGSIAEKGAVHEKLNREMVQKRMVKKNHPKDLLSELLDPKHNLTQAEIDIHFSTIVLAGSETTNVALCAVTYYLARNPLAKARVIQEIRGGFASADEITAISTKKLSFMQACLTEALRKFPPSAVVFPRRVPPGGDYIDGNWIPGDMQVGICVFCAHNSSLNFRDPQQFVPERWLGDEKYKDDDRQAMQAFSYGPRNCLGQNLAKTELRLILARFIWEFDWELTPETGDWDQTLVFRGWVKKPLKLVLTPVR
jgi:cytochrome P450